MEKNNKGKYLKYAIGEIILVVIGILIALQINNWNEVNKNKHIETLFLQDFVTDLKSDIETLKVAIVGNNLKLNAADSIIATLSNKNTLTSNELPTFISYNEELTGESYFIPEKSTIRQFEAGNNTQIIASKNLKDKLFRYYAYNDKSEQNMEKSLQLYQHNFITKDVFQSIFGGNVLKHLIGSDLGRPDLNLNDLKQNTDYIFSVVAKKSGTAIQNRNYQLIIDSAEELIILLNGELDE